MTYLGDHQLLFIYEHVDTSDSQYWEQAILFPMDIFAQKLSNKKEHWYWMNPSILR
jgi:hypothetical protein